MRPAVTVTVRSLSALAVVLLMAFAVGAWRSSAQQSAQPAGDPCAVNNGGCAAGVGCKQGSTPGCHKLSACRNTPGSRTCSTCPKDFAGDGYVGCFDVNECPAGDCSDRIPTGADKAAPPVVTTSGDVTVTATSEAGAAATFTASAKDPAEGNKQAYCLPRSGSTFAIGKTTVSCWAVNKVGKIGRTALTVTVNRPQF
jgi:hypothetical protein